MQTHKTLELRIFFRRSCDIHRREPFKFRVLANRNGAWKIDCVCCPGTSFRNGLMSGPSDCGSLCCMLWVGSRLGPRNVARQGAGHDLDAVTRNSAFAERRFCRSDDDKVDKTGCPENQRCAVQRKASADKDTASARSIGSSAIGSGLVGQSPDPFGEHQTMCGARVLPSWTVRWTGHRSCDFCPQAEPRRSSVEPVNNRP